MGREWSGLYAPVREHFEQADRILGRPISRLAFEGPADELKETINSQPAIFVLNCGCHALWEEFQPSAVAGHSLGEFSALVASGAMDFPEVLKIVKKRAELMQESAERLPGAMLAVLGLQKETVEGLVETSKERGIAALANYNCPGQTVVSCETGLAEGLQAQFLKEGAKKVVRLPVSGAFHSPLVSEAAEIFAAYLQGVSFREPKTVLVSNLTGRGTSDAAEIKRNLAGQMSSPVRWEESVGWMLDQGIEVFVEVGPGKVLQGLIRGISRSAEVRSMEDGSLDELRGWLRAKLNR